MDISNLKFCSIQILKLRISCHILRVEKEIKKVMEASDDGMIPNSLMLVGSLSFCILEEQKIQRFNL